MLNKRRMTGAELAVNRSALGLTTTELARHLNVRADTVRHWESEQEPIPFRIPSELAELTEQQQEEARKITGTGTVKIPRREGWAIGVTRRALELDSSLSIRWRR